MTDLDADYRLLRTSVGACWIDRDVVSVHGPAAVTFLQGQVSQDVASLPVGGSAWTWVLQPQGKVEALCRATRVAEDHLLLDTDGGWGEALAGRLNRFKLRTKAEIVPLAWRCLALRGPGIAALTLTEPADEGIDVDAGWPGVAGVDRLGVDPALPAGVAVVDRAAFELVRIEAGWPRMGAELSDKTIPAETGLVPATVSFTKGCYTGQELVARIDSRGGHVPRHLCAVVADQAAPVGATVAVGDKTVGRLTSVAARPGGATVALAYLGRDVSVPGPVSLRWDGGATEGRAEALPLAV